jgi:hypothetical protein
LDCESPAIRELLKVVGDKQCSVRDMMSALNLRDRKNLLNNYLNPAISGGWVKLLYPGSPRHPRQKYLLGARALAFVRAAK